MLMSRTAVMNRSALRIALVAALIAPLAVATITFAVPGGTGGTALPPANTRTNSVGSTDQSRSGAPSVGEAARRSTGGILTPVRKTDKGIVLEPVAGADARDAVLRDPVCPNAEPCGP
jgi:hypothetical protein